MPDSSIIRPNFLSKLNDMQKKSIKKIEIIPTVTNNTVTILGDFIYNTKQYRLSVTIPAGPYEGAKRTEGNLFYSSCNLSDDVLNQIFYESIIFERSQEVFYRVLLGALYDIKLKENLSNDEYLELIVAYVQSLKYDHTKVKMGGNLHLNFPIETAVDGTGVCSDKSLLMAGLLSCSGYAVALLSYHSLDHMMVGLPRRINPDLKETDYICVESTSPTFIGMHPEFEKHGLTYPVKPDKIVPVGNGKIIYGMSKELKEITKIMKHLSSELDCDDDCRVMFLPQGLIYNAKVKLYNDVLHGRKSPSLVAKNLKIFKWFI